MSNYDLAVAEARQTARRADALVTMVRWGMAAHLAGDVLDRLEAVCQARQAAETAFHQAVYTANEAGYPWRELAEVTDTPWESLYRRYHVRPKRMPVRPSAYRY